MRQKKILIKTENKKVQVTIFSSDKNLIGLFSNHIKI